jgi:hypothetical protein
VTHAAPIRLGGPSRHRRGIRGSGDRVTRAAEAAAEVDRRSPLSAVVLCGLGASDALAALQPPNPDLLSQPAGVLLLLTYAAVLSAGAATAVHQRDEDQGALLAAHEGRVGHRG